MRTRFGSSPASSLLARPDVRSAIETFVQINRIAEENLLRIDLIGPDLEIGEPGLAIDRGESAVHGIQSVGDLDAANARDVVAGVEGIPVPPQIDFAVGVKIHR